MGRRTPHLLLVPLDSAMMRARLASDEFTCTRELGGSSLLLHVGSEFPGEALGLYPHWLDALPEGIVPGTFVVVVPVGDVHEVVGQLGTIGPVADGVEVGYGINPSWQGRGIATAALGQLLDRLAAQGVHRVVATTAADNAASVAVLRHHGFVPAHVGQHDGDLGWLREGTSSPIATGEPARQRPCQ